jgi:hypothetical protein
LNVSLEMVTSFFLSERFTWNGELVWAVSAVSPQWRNFVAFRTVSLKMTFVPYSETFSSNDEFVNTLRTISFIRLICVTIANGCC